MVATRRAACGVGVDPSYRKLSWRGQFKSPMKPFPVTYVLNNGKQLVHTVLLVGQVMGKAQANAGCMACLDLAHEQ